MTHPSVGHEGTHTTENNQRLEFLGDAVLNLIITTELYQKFPEHDEGALTKRRAELVNRRSLSTLARQLGLGDTLRLGRGEEKCGGRHRESNLADVCESLLGAVYLDGGFEATRTVILNLFQELMGPPPLVPRLFNPKGELQEALQAAGAEPPQYRPIGEPTGPDHDREFEYAVFHGGRELGRGKGRTKQAAETEAAIVAMATLRQTVEPPSA